MELVVCDCDRVCVAIGITGASDASIEIQAHKMRVVVENDRRRCLETGASASEKDGEDEDDDGGKRHNSLSFPMTSAAD